MIRLQPNVWLHNESVLIFSIIDNKWYAPEVYLKFLKFMVMISINEIEKISKELEAGEFIPTKTLKKYEEDVKDYQALLKVLESERQKYEYLFSAMKGVSVN